MRHIIILCILILTSSWLVGQADRFNLDHTVLDSSRCLSVGPELDYYTPDNPEFYNDTEAVLFKRIEKGICDNVVEITVSLRYFDGMSNPYIDWHNVGKTWSQRVIENRCDGTRKQFFKVEMLDTVTTSKIIIEAVADIGWGDVTFTDTIFIKNSAPSNVTHTRGDNWNRALRVEGNRLIALGRTLTLNDVPFIDTLTWWDFWQRWDFEIPDASEAAAAADQLQALAVTYGKWIVEWPDLTQTHNGYYNYGNTAEGVIGRDIVDNILPVISPAIRNYTRTIGFFTTDEPSQDAAFNPEIGASGETHVGLHNERLNFIGGPNWIGGYAPVFAGQSADHVDKPLWLEGYTTGVGGIHYYHPGWKELPQIHSNLQLQRMIADKYGHAIRYQLINSEMNVTASHLPMTESEYKAHTLLMLMYNNIVSHYLFTGQVDHRYQNRWMREIKDIKDAIQEHLSYEIEYDVNYPNNPLLETGNGFVEFFASSLNPQSELFLMYVNTSRNSIDFSIEMPWLPAGASVEPFFPGDPSPTLTVNTLSETIEPLGYRIIKVNTTGIFNQRPQFNLDEEIGGSPITSYYPGTDFETTANWNCTGCSSSLLSAQSDDRIQGNALRARRDGIANNANLWVQHTGSPTIDSNYVYFVRGWMKYDSAEITTPNNIGWGYIDVNSGISTSRVDGQGSYLNPRGFQGWYKFFGMMNVYADNNYRLDWNLVNMKAEGGSWRSGFKLDQAIVLREPITQSFASVHLPQNGKNMVMNPSLDYERLPNYPAFWRPFCRDRGNVCIDKGLVFTDVWLNPGDKFHGVNALWMDVSEISQLVSKPTNQSTRYEMIPLRNGQQYTMSFYAKATQAMTIELDLDNLVNNTFFNITTSWARYTVTATSSDDHTVIRFTFPDQSGDLGLDAVQIEEGASATTFDDEMYLPDPFSSN